MKLRVGTHICFVLFLILFNLNFSLAAGVVARQKQNPPSQKIPQRKSIPASRALAAHQRDNPAQQDVVDLSAIWLQLKYSSEIWIRIIDPAPKEITVRKYIDMFAEQGIMINQPPAHYVKLIDDMAAHNPDLLKQPFDAVLRFMAIMEYDYNNGMDQDQLARQVLGDTLYYQNKKRLGRD